MVLVFIVGLVVTLVFVCINSILNMLVPVSNSIVQPDYSIKFVVIILYILLNRVRVNSEEVRFS